MKVLQEKIQDLTNELAVYRTRVGGSKYSLATPTASDAAEGSGDINTVVNVDANNCILDATTTVQALVQQALTSDNISVIKTELMKQMERYEYLRNNNMKLIQKLQTISGNIQVFCRPRPPSDAELGTHSLTHSLTHLTTYSLTHS
jgi:hypothetical protein